VPISELEEFVQIANKMNFSKAAESLYLSQSALSKKVSRLEEKLGFKIFDRDTRSVQLTPAGKSFYRDAIEIVGKFQQSVERAVELSREQRPIVRVGGDLGNLGIFKTVEALRAYSETFGLQFDIEVRYSNPGIARTSPSANDSLEDALNGEDDLSVIFLSTPTYDSRLSIVPLYKDPLVAYVPANKGYREGQTISLCDLKDFYFVWPNTWRMVWHHIEEVCKSLGFSPKKQPRLVEYMGDLTNRGDNEVIILSDSMSFFMAPTSVSGLVKVNLSDPCAYIEVGAVYLPEKANEHIEWCAQVLQKISVDQWETCTRLNKPTGAESATAANPEE